MARFSIEADQEVVGDATALPHAKHESAAVSEALLITKQQALVDQSCSRGHSHHD